METRISHCLFLILSEWICLLSLTSILGVTKAEIRCIPSCQLPLIRAFPREVAALDMTDFAEAAADEFIGFTEGSPGTKSTTGEDENHYVAELPASEVSSLKVLQPLEGKNALNGHHKLSHPKVFSQSASHAAANSPFDGNLTENSSSSSDGKNNSFYGENGTQFDGTVNEDVASWRRTRSARSAGTWSGFRAEGGEDASFSDQEEFQLTSSTFALTGDTAHNQAMVHWSGQNSSVSG